MDALQNLIEAAEDALNGGIFKHPSVADRLRDAIAMAKIVMAKYTEGE